MWRLLLSIWSVKKDCAFRKLRKITMLACVLLFMIPLSLTACGGRANTSSSVYPNIDDADIPDILEKRWVQWEIRILLLLGNQTTRIIGLIWR